MSEMSFPYGSSNHDRRYKSSDFRSYYAQMIGNGVYYANANALKVRESEGMTVLLGTGGAFIEGVGYRNTSDLAFTLDIADGALSRIDRIVIRNDYKKRDTYAAVLKGTYSANPQAAALTRNADAYEIAVADVLVAKGVISITQAAITDTRLNNDLCGIVTGLIQQADTTEIFNQFTTFLNEFKQGHVTEFNGWTEEQKQEFVAWENGIKDILNENMAGNLLNMIGELERLETTEKGNLVGAVNEVFRSGNEKKQRLVSNLIAMGMQADTSETLDGLIDKVLEMTNTSEDTVTEAVLLEGYTAHDATGEQVTGIIPELAAVTVDATNVTQDDTYTYFEMPEGHYDEHSKVRSANSNLGKINGLICFLGAAANISSLPNFNKYTSNNFRAYMSSATATARNIDVDGYTTGNAATNVSYNNTTGIATASVSTSISGNSSGFVTATTGTIGCIIFNPNGF